MGFKLGIIADDFTGGTDIATLMTQQGWHVVQLLGTPSEKQLLPDADAVIISLKSRSIPADQAVQLSLEAASWLQANGCSQLFFKYCSTFDSTSEGNIGPVTDALLDKVQSDFTVLAPALPIIGRTVLHGHLFVNGTLLHESGMQHHPITPMKSSNLLKLMAGQARGQVGLVDLTAIRQGITAVKEELLTLHSQGYRYAITDSLTMEDLSILAAAVHKMPLVTGGSGLAAALAALDLSRPIRRQTSSGNHKVLGVGVPPRKFRAAILSGSCSTMTNSQVAYYRRLAPTRTLEIERCLADCPGYANELASWILDQPCYLAPLIYSTQPPALLAAAQQRYPSGLVSGAIEETLALTAKELVNHGVRALIIAGGETSGAILQHLETRALQVGAPIAPSVPWMKDLHTPLWLALKSGNFGTEDFFVAAQDYRLPAPPTLTL